MAENMNKNIGRQRKSGRKPKADPAIHRYGIKLNNDENFRFLQMFEKSGMDRYAKFIKAVLLKREIKVVKVDKTTLDYYIRLTDFHRQFRAIGNNYNQILLALKTNFGEKKALQMIYGLERRTIELAVLSKRIADLTLEYERKWLQK